MSFLDSHGGVGEERNDGKTCLRYLGRPLPAVEMVLAGAHLVRAGVAAFHQLLHRVVHIQDPAHQTVHLLVQTLKPAEEEGTFSERPRPWGPAYFLVLSNCLLPDLLTLPPHLSFQALLPAPLLPTCYLHARSSGLSPGPSHFPSRPACTLRPHSQTYDPHISGSCPNLFPLELSPASTSAAPLLGVLTPSVTQIHSSISPQICSSSGSLSQAQPHHPPGQSPGPCFEQLPTPSLSILMAYPLGFLPWSSLVPSYLDLHPSCLRGLPATTVTPSNPLSI